VDPRQQTNELFTISTARLLDEISLMLDQSFHLMGVCLLGQLQGGPCSSGSGTGLDAKHRHTE